MCVNWSETRFQKKYSTEPVEPLVGPAWTCHADRSRSNLEVSEMYV